MTIVLKTASTVTLAAAIAFSAFAGAASAQQALNIGPGNVAPGPGNIGAPPPGQVVGGCPHGYQTVIRIDAYGNQAIFCHLAQRPDRPIVPIGAIIGGIVGGIVAGGHR